PPEVDTFTETAPVYEPERTIWRVAVPAFSERLRLPVANATWAVPTLEGSVTGFVVVPVSPTLVTTSDTGVVTPLKISAWNDAVPAIAVTVVSPLRVPCDPAGSATDTL